MRSAVEDRNEGKSSSYIFFLKEERGGGGGKKSTKLYFKRSLGHVMWLQCVHFSRKPSKCKWTLSTTCSIYRHKTYSWWNQTYSKEQSYSLQRYFWESTSHSPSHYFISQWSWNIKPNIKTSGLMCSRETLHHCTKCSSLFLQAVRCIMGVLHPGYIIWTLGYCRGLWDFIVGVRWTFTSMAVSI